MREIQATPAQLRWLACNEPALFPCLFDSPSGGPLGRHMLLPAATGATLVLWGDGRLEAAGPHAAAGEGPSLAPGDFRACLDAWWRALQLPADPASELFAGGWCLYLAYEFAAQLEPGLRLPRLAAGQPLAWAGRADAAIVFDLEASSCQLVAEAGSEQRLDELAAALARAAGALSQQPARPSLPTANVSEEAPEQFTAAVLAAQEAIAAGEVYQANLSRAWRLQFARDPGPAALYEALLHANPAPFAALAHLPGGARLLCSSPERLVRVRAGRIETRPIAGTRPRPRPRAHGARADAPERAALLAHPKERAEHVMLIDLERNDLGRVCEAGSVQVDEFMVTETYQHVHHIVSNVSGRLRAGTTPGDVLRAVFPGGTITGCPKLRSIDLIATLERGARGPYTGSLGYLGRDGSMDMNILIRTALQQGASLELRAGAGIVADSDPQRELAETRAKARGLLCAFGAEP
jgi:anthranilate synthase component 1